MNKHPKIKKNDYYDINKVIKYLIWCVKGGNASKDSSQKESIHNDILDINSSYKNDSVLKYFNVNQWLSDRNQMNIEFIKSCFGLTNDDTNSKKILCVAHSVGSLYKARCKRHYIFLDNNQILSRNWHVKYDHKSKVSAITTVIHIVPRFPAHLQMAPYFPFKMVV